MYLIARFIVRQWMGLPVASSVVAPPIRHQILLALDMLRCEAKAVFAHKRPNLPGDHLDGLEVGRLLV